MGESPHSCVRTTVCSALLSNSLPGSSSRKRSARSPAQMRRMREDGEEASDDEEDEEEDEQVRAGALSFTCLAQFSEEMTDLT